MARFKKGDRVRLLSVTKTQAEEVGVSVGDIVTIEEDNSDIPYVDKKTPSYHMILEHDQQVELVEEPSEKCSLKVGDRVKIIGCSRGRYRCRFLEAEHIGKEGVVDHLDRNHEGTTCVRVKLNGRGSIIGCMPHQAVELVETTEDPKQSNHEFKVGDRVKVLAYSDNKDLIGKTATVVDPGAFVQIHIDGWDSGWSGNNGNHTCVCGCWGIDENEIVKILESPDDTTDQKSTPEAEEQFTMEYSADRTEGRTISVYDEVGHHRRTALSNLGYDVQVKPRPSTKWVPQEGDRVKIKDAVACERAKGISNGDIGTVYDDYPSLPGVEFDNGIRDGGIAPERLEFLSRPDALPIPKRDVFGKLKQVTELINKKKESITMNNKTYRTLVDLPNLEAGAILKKDTSNYKAIDAIWDTDAGTKFREQFDYNSLPTVLVENSPEFFEQVFETSWLGKAVYQTKAAAKTEAAKLFKK